MNDLHEAIGELRETGLEADVVENDAVPAMPPCHTTVLQGPPCGC